MVRVRGLGSGYGTNTLYIITPFYHATSGKNLKKKEHVTKKPSEIRLKKKIYVVILK